MTANEIQKAIRTSIKAGDLDEVKRLIDEDASRLHLITPFGTWLHVAASLGKQDIVE